MRFVRCACCIRCELNTACTARCELGALRIPACCALRDALRAALSAARRTLHAAHYVRFALRARTRCVSIRTTIAAKFRPDPGHLLGSSLFLNIVNYRLCN
jgi:hypothetical protein